MRIIWWVAGVLTAVAAIILAAYAAVAFEVAKPATETVFDDRPLQPQPLLTAVRTGSGIY